MRDKAKVEVAVQVAQRWILARLRDETFFSLEALSERIAELLEYLHGRPMKTHGGPSLRDLFERIDRPTRKPLPEQRFVHGQWLCPRVNLDYHIEVDHHLYPVPHTLLHQRVDVRLTATTVEASLRNKQVWVHRRRFEHGRHTTVAEHMPKAHQAHLEWSPSRMVRWGAAIGPQTAALVQSILESRLHPEQGYRSCLGILRLAKRHGNMRLKAAAARAIAVGARSYRHLDSITRSSRTPRTRPSASTSALRWSATAASRTSTTRPSASSTRLQIRRLATCRWVQEHHNVLVTGPTGVGKTYVACALAQQACRNGYRTTYRRLARFFDELDLARADGSYTKPLAKLARIDVLVGVRSTVIASQLPPEKWHDYVGDPTVAGAVLDRIVHRAPRIAIRSPSRRKENATKR